MDLIWLFHFSTVSGGYCFWTDYGCSFLAFYVGSFLGPSMAVLFLDRVWCFFLGHSRRLFLGPSMLVLFVGISVTVLFFGPSMVVLFGTFHGGSFLDRLWWFFF